MKTVLNLESALVLLTLTANTYSGQQRIQNDLGLESFYGESVEFELENESERFHFGQRTEDFDTQGFPKHYFELSTAEEGSGILNSQNVGDIMAILERFETTEEELGLVGFAH